MTATPTEETRDLIARYLDLKTQTERLTEQMDLIKDRLHTLHPHGVDAGDGHKVTVSSAGRINEQALMSAFPAAEHPELYTVKPVTAKVRAKISPEQLKPFLTYSKPSVRIS